MEVWKPIPGYEGYYEASDAGRVRSLDRFTESGRYHQGRILKQATKPSGHKVVGLSRGGKLKTFKVHRLVLMAHVGEPEDGQITLHWNDVPDDNRLSNLRWGNHKENGEDRVRNWPDKVRAVLAEMDEGLIGGNSEIFFGGANAHRTRTVPPTL